jgi:DNA-binding PadR family transcriptional regulator
MKKSKDEPTDLLPMNHADFHIMLALAETELHGYGIMQRVSGITDRKLRLGPGTLYTAIKRLLDGGLIEESAERPDPELDDDRRRYYKLTRFGHRVLAAEAERLQSLLKVVGAINVLKRV